MHGWGRSPRRWFAWVSAAADVGVAQAAMTRGWAETKRPLAVAGWHDGAPSSRARRSSAARERRLGSGTSQWVAAKPWSVLHTSPCRVRRPEGHHRRPSARHCIVTGLAALSRAARLLCRGLGGDSRQPHQEGRLIRVARAANNRRRELRAAPHVPWIGLEADLLRHLGRGVTRSVRVDVYLDVV